MLRERTEEEAPEHRPEARVRRVALAVAQSPSSVIVRRHIRGIEPIPARQGDCVGKNGAGDRVTWTKSCTVHYGFRFFALQTD